ncbi:hypothetical protein M9H77_03389 [Catharanthus roseus]|uniref:Uncharacterized protein n=1 Tax=Catharanthus roseus TaxID=4058 RepID=A0ACC0CB44_CATRO|nr:hypothetical protein M9H77_03389 [Catharanthus roseus]
MYRSGAPHRSARGLQCTWLVPRTRASFDGVDVLDSGEWIHLKRGVDRRGCGPISLRVHYIILCDGMAALWRARRGLKLINSGRLVPRGTQIPYSAAVDLVEGLGVSQVGGIGRDSKNGLID